MSEPQDRFRDPNPASDSGPAQFAPQTPAYGYGGAFGGGEVAAPPPARREPWATRAELAFAAEVVGALLIVGIVMGLLWALWSRTPTRGLAYYNSTIVPDETEGFISSDGRFVVLTGLVGLAAGTLAWFRCSRRGPVTVGALVVGTVAGAALTNVMGHLVGGGSTAGKLGTQLARLPLQVHAIGLLFVEGSLALLVYLLCTLFATPDDLGVEPPPDAARDVALTAP